MTFLFLDVLRPGFVSDVFSVHWFLLGALVCGAAAISITPPAMEGKGVAKIVGTLLAGTILSLLVWRAGEAFGDLRIFLAILAFVLPWGLTRTL